MKEIRHIEYAMGTMVEIVAFAEDDESPSVVHRAMHEFARLEKMFSRFDSESELSRVNREAASRPVAVSDEFFEVLSRGVRYCALSGDCFSITLAPLIRLWEECAAQNTPPAESELDRARELSDYRLVELDENSGTVRFGRHGVAFDLGGLVKGYAVDKAGAILLDGSLCGAMINAGTSSIAVFGFNSSGERWDIGIRHPLNERAIIGVLPLADRAVSTSGTGERRFKLRGRNYSHLLDPRTGWPLERAASATAVCESAMTSEVASKLLLFLGCEKALEICDANGWNIEGATFTLSGDGVEARHSDALAIAL